MPLAPGVQNSDLSSDFDIFWLFIPSLLLPTHNLELFCFLFKIVFHSNKHTSSHIPGPHPLPSHPRLFALLNHLFPPCLRIQMTLFCFCTIHSLIRTTVLGTKHLILDVYTHTRTHTMAVMMIFAAGQTDCHHHGTYSEAEAQLFQHGVDESVLPLAVCQESAHRQCAEEDPLMPQDAHVANHPETLQGEADQMRQ